MAPRQRLSAAERDRQVEFLRSRIQYYEGVIRDSLKGINEAIFAFFTLAGVAIALVLQYHIFAVCAFIPFALLIAMLIGLNNMAELFALAAYQSYLEDRLARIEPPRSRIVGWERSGGAVRRRALVYKVIQGTFGLGVVILTAFSAFACWVHFPREHALLIAGGSIYALLAALVIAAYVEAVRTPRRTEQAIAAAQGTP